MASTYNRSKLERACDNTSLIKARLRHALRRNDPTNVVNYEKQLVQSLINLQQELINSTNELLEESRSNRIQALMN